jgi:hypothetical protein
MVYIVQISAPRTLQLYFFENAHFTAVLFRKCTRVHTLQICALVHPVHLVHPHYTLQSHYFLKVHQSAHVTISCTFMHLVHPVLPVQCAPDSHTYFKMHHSAHSASAHLCTLCTQCTQFILRTSEPWFLDGSSKIQSAHVTTCALLCTLCTQCTQCTWYTYFFENAPECTIRRYVYPVHPVHYVHLWAALVHKILFIFCVMCTFVYLLSCFLFRPCTFAFTALQDQNYGELYTFECTPVTGPCDSAIVFC